MPFVLGSYVVTAIVVLVEIVAVRARLRAATRAVAESGGDPLHAANPEPHR